MAYNYLRRADSIRNSTLCINDSNSAYEVSWYENGNLEGWDSYNLLHTYGVWDNVLFATSFGGDAYFGRSTYFPPVAAEDYYILTFQMKVIVADENRDNITGGKVQWLRSGDLVWDTDKEAEFEVERDNKWRLYSINLGPEQWWQGDIRNIRIYPFLNSRKGDQFFIRNLAIRAPATFQCRQSACDFYSQYSHPCQGVGARGSCMAGDPLTTTVDIVEDVNDRLIVNIDGYGDQPIRLLPAAGLTRKEVAQEIEKGLTRIDIGGYVNAIVEEDVDKLKISSGSFADDSNIVLTHTQLAEDLGFFDGASDISIKTTGTNHASEFEFQATYRLRGVEIYKLVDGDKENTAFYHDPTKYEVEAGRQDWQERAKGVLGSEVEYESFYYPTFSGTGRTIIDFTHPFNSSGRVRKVFVMCNVADPSTGAKLKLFRPKKDGTLDTVYETAFGTDVSGYIYSQIRDTYIIDTDFRVRKGDLLGFYDIDMYIGDVITTNPDAMFYYFSGEATGSFNPGELLVFGNLGLNYYARGTNRQDLALLDIDMGDRISVESLVFYGEEITEDFEFNVAICDDINWSVNLFGGTHSHFVDDALTPENSYTATHNNIAYGTLLLGDGVTHTEDALAGTSYGDGVNNNGFYTGGTTYFYVNGDAEWLNESPGESALPLTIYTTYPPADFERDPIAFNLTFQDNKDLHRTRIFFKERENFVRFHWSYFLGQYNYTGNTYNNRYKYIPAYTAVSLDETVFTPDYEDENVTAFLFSNPTDGSWSQGDYDPSTGYYSLGGDQDAAMAAAVLRWNVLGHEFDPINTKSIQFYTNYHKSTKLMEIEVYSKVPNDPSLLDDVYLQYSREGDYWFDSIFEDQTVNGEELTTALINDNPRYLRLEIRSSSALTFKEFDLRLNSDSVRSGDDKCLLDIYFNTTKRGEVNPSYSFPIWNTYEEEADFEVDIPRDEGDSRLVLWSKMGSAGEVDFPEIGPGGQYYKNPDYPLYNYDYNVAINCPCWGLRDLVLDKSVYFSEDGSFWEFNTTYSGSSLNISHSGNKITTININPVSAKYFRFVPSDISFSGLENIYVYFNNTKIDYTYYNETPNLEIGFISNIAIDKASFFIPDQTLGASPSIDVYISYNGISYVLWQTITTFEKINDSYYSYIAIDLSQRHTLDVIRHYGTGASSFDIASYKKYFSEDTSDVTQIDPTIAESGSINDCRWLVVVIPEAKTVRKIGIYPDIRTKDAPGGGYNHYWDDLGTILTDYETKTNVAFNATVSGSSSEAGLIPEFAVDGIIPNGDVTRVWGTDDSPTQWLKIYLDDEYSVDEFRCYWGYYSADDDWLITDYKIYTSIDDITYYERVSIAGNTEHFRTHILTSPIQARYVRIDISGYDAGTIPILTDAGVVNFEGATVREIEVLEAAAMTYISSEDHPIVTVNLRNKFQLTGYDLVQYYPDDATTHWSNDQVRYSANTFGEPHKIKYEDYGVPLTQVQWVSIKNDTATEWNDGPDYLDNIKALNLNYHLIHKYSWWWNSDYSSLSTDYNFKTTDRSLKIAYTGGPTLSGAETLEFIEGASLGTDTYFSEMDLLSFDLYIPDVSKLDNYGSVIFGDFAGLRYHVWDLSTTISGLSNGWNYINLKFKDADPKVTNEGVVAAYDVNVATLNNYEDLELKSFKFRFRGKGDPLTIYLDNLRIERNTFHENMQFDKGLYLSNSEYLQFPLSEFDPHKGSLEFWFKPDYNYYGMDSFYNFDSRTIFAFSNIANDIFGLYVLKGRGLAIVTGNSDFMNIQYVGSHPDYYFDIGDVFHLAFVWSNDGTAIDSHGTTIRLYINNQLIGSSQSQWEIRDTKSSRLLIGGAVSQKATSEDPTTIWGVVDNLKVYNYCKNDFSDRFMEDIDSIDIVSPNSFLEISKDGTNFYDRNSDQLPLVYENVAPGDYRTVWVRTNIPEDLTGAEKRTAQLIIEAIRSF